MAKTALITHPDCLLHCPPTGHPESPARLSAVLDGLSGPEFGALVRIEAPLGHDEDISRVHPLAHMTNIRAQAPTSDNRAVALDPDTYLSAGSLAAASRSVGAVIAGIDAVMKSEVDCAFCASRPPGHHAQTDRAMGFCIWNSVAVGALYARSAYGIERVAVIDFDVHHGNGSQEIAQLDRNFFYASIHQGGIYPGSGFAHETAFGNLVNVPLPAHTKSDAWRDAFQSIIIPALQGFNAELVIVSAGFDAHYRDPLASFDLETDDFAWATNALLQVTQGKLVSTLEGGYHLGALADCARAHVGAMLAYNKHAGGVI
jgi:acetoin utilization deacetylase AcuC-like enzyme